MKIIALIGARANPKGEEWTLGGYPLVMWPYTAASGSKYIGRFNTYISSNSKVLRSKIEDRISPVTWITRPDDLASSTATDLQWVSNALQYLRRTKTNPDLIVHLRATTPLIDPDLIDRAIEEFLKHPEATSLRSAHELPESPYKMFKRDGDYWKSFMDTSLESTNLPRQQFVKCYHPNGYVDILRPSVIDAGTLHGSKILAFETPRIIEIDDEQALKENELHIEDCPMWNSKFWKLVEAR